MDKPTPQAAAVTPTVFTSLFERALLNRVPAVASPEPVHFHGLRWEKKVSYSVKTNPKHKTTPG